MDNFDSTVCSSLGCAGNATRCIFLERSPRTVDLFAVAKMENFAARNHLQLPSKLEPSIRVIHDVGVIDVGTHSNTFSGASAKVQTRISFFWIGRKVMLLMIGLKCSFLFSEMVI